MLVALYITVVCFSALAGVHILNGPRSKDLTATEDFCAVLLTVGCVIFVGGAIMMLFYVNMKAYHRSG